MNDLINVITIILKKIPSINMKNFVFDFSWYCFMHLD